MVNPHPSTRISTENQCAAPAILSNMMVMMLATMSTNSQMSNFLPAGVSDLKMMAYICSFDNERYRLGSNTVNSVRCSRSPIKLTILRAIFPKGMDAIISPIRLSPSLI